MHDDPTRERTSPASDRTDLLHAEKDRILERIARGDALEAVLDGIIRFIEQNLPGVRSSLLLLSRDGRHLEHLAAPSLPEEYTGAIDGLAVGPGAGSCGTAAYRREPVVVTDIATDPLWDAFRDVALRHELRACWSMPLWSPDARLLGTFALYYRESRAPSEEEQQFAQVAAYLAEIVIERQQREEALEEGEERYRSLFESIDEAFAVVRVLVDDDGHPYDIVFESTNPAFEAQGGPKNAEGRSLRDLMPNVDPYWIELYARVAATHESEHVLHHSSATKRWFDGFVFPIGTPDRRRVGLLFRDVTGEKEAEEAHQARERYVRQMADTAPAILWFADAEGRATFVNAGWSEFTGQSQEHVLDEGWVDAVHPDDREGIVRAFRAALGDGAPLSQEFRLRRADGAYRWVSTTARPLFDDDGGLRSYVGAVYDIHDRVLQGERQERLAAFRRNVMELLEESLQVGNAEGFHQRVLDRAVTVIPGAQAGALLELGEDGAFGFVAANGFDLHALRPVRLSRRAAGFGRLVDRPSPQIVRRPRTHPEVVGADARILDVAGRATQIRATLLVPILRHGTMTALLTLDNFEDEDAFTDEAIEMARVFAGHVGTILQRLRMEREMQVLAYQDSLTGLPNRARFKTHLAERLAKAEADGTQVALLFVDLDNLKPINDSLGHRVGDEVLREIGERLQQFTRSSDLVARLGGDEFTVVLTGDGVERDAERLAARILATLARPVRSDRHDLHMSASIGISVFPEHGAEAEDLLKHADIAMYHAKQRGKSTYAFFVPEMQAAPLERLLLEEALREGLERDEFVLHFQPRVNVATGRITSLEALVRWEHPERGLVPPGLFIPLAEATNLIHPLGKRILQMAVRQAKAWRDAGHADVRVAVNLSPKQLERADLVGEVREVLEAADLPPTALELEVVESVAVKDAANAGAKLSDLRDLGVRIALDDFGMGYSSLSYLSELPIDTIKIDRTFLKNIRAGGGEEQVAIVRAIRVLGTSFGLSVVAEGVETEDQWHALRAVGCDEAQGYLLSRPLPAERVADALLAAGSLSP